ncbi:UNVERIFIED_CONTAM: hypothetical protein HDU68_012485 [Siphonaria sp. JEL0065]|nr:hypothetical protein HDU68_012485 [Siphonaria sp. JEL0065]
MILRMTSMGEKEGIKFSYGGLVGNSLDFCRLIRLAGTFSQECKQKVVEHLLSAFFEHEKNIADVKTLVEAANAGGINASLVRKEIYGGWFFTGGKLMLKETLDAVEMAKERGIMAVPHFTINGIAIGGAQDSQVFERLFEKQYQNQL